MTQWLTKIISRIWLVRFKLSTARAVQGYGDVNIDSSSPGRHTPGY